MASWLMWVILISVALLLWAVGTFYSLRPLRWVSLITAAAVTIAIIRYGYGLSHPPPANLVNAFNNGVDGVIKALLHVLWLGRSAPSPGPVGRGILAFLVLLGYRALEAWTMRRQAPRLDTSVIGDGQASIKPDSGPGSRGLTDGQRHDRLADELRFRLSAMKMRSPAILPGGSKPNELASIAEASGNPTAGLAGAIIAFAGAIWPNPRRFLLKVRVEPQHAARAERGTWGPSGTRVTVDLDDARTGATISSKTVAARDDEEAASMVAGYVARQMFAKDRATPPWCYGAIDGSDLGAWLLSGLQRVPAGSMDAVQQARERQIECMWQAAEGGVAAGVVRYELAQLLDLAKDVDRLGLHELRLRALRLHAMNRQQYPRFCRGRYRLAMSLQMICNPDHPLFHADDMETTLQDTLAILRQCGAMKGELIDECLAKQGGGRCRLKPEVRRKLLETAAIELRYLRRQLCLWWVVWDTLRRRDERSTWRPHWRTRHRQEFRDGVRVAELLVAVRRKLLHEELGETAPLFGRIALARLWMAMRITSAITGDREDIRWILTRPHGDKQPMRAAGVLEPVAPAGEDKVRRLPCRRRTASWMAEYNTACLYAALVYKVPDAVDKVVVSLERATSNPDSEMERAYDWVSRDPDFTAVEQLSPFKEFCEAQKRNDYPDPFTSRTPRHNGHARTAAAVVAAAKNGA